MCEIITLRELNIFFTGSSVAHDADDNNDADDDDELVDPLLTPCNKITGKEGPPSSGICFSWW